MGEAREPSREELEGAHCWEPSDRVPGDPATTAFRRRARLHQARWREAHGHPIGSQPINPKPGGPSRPVGSRLPTAHARETGAAFVGDAARVAATARTRVKEPHQTFDRQRLWADLLWAPALAVNVFAGADDAAVRRWWPDVPGTVAEVRFEHSPGRLDPAYLGNLSSFAAAVVLDPTDTTDTSASADTTDTDHISDADTRGDTGDTGTSGTRGIVGVRAIYADLIRAEVPKPGNLPRYREVAERSDVFADDRLAAAFSDGGRSDLTEIWLDHLLVLSMLQHPSGAWSWGRLVLLHPADHAQAADAAARYRELLRAGADEPTFATMSLEHALDGAPATLRDRYLIG